MCNACSHKYSNITTLNVSSNPIGCIGASFLATCLKKTSTLRTLILNKCSLGIRLATNDGDIKSKTNNNHNYTNNDNDNVDTTLNKKHDATGIFDIISVLGYTQSLTSLSMGDNYCHDDQKILLKAIGVLCRHLPNTQLTHLDVSSIGLGSHGIYEIGKALRKASGVDDVIKLKKNHKLFVQNINAQIQLIEKKLKNSIIKLKNIREYIFKKKNEMTMNHESFHLKNRSMINDIQKRASRKSPVKQQRQEQAAKDKMQYTSRLMGRNVILSKKIEEIEELETYPLRVRRIISFLNVVLIFNFIS